LTAKIRNRNKEITISVAQLSDRRKPSLIKSRQTKFKLNLKRFKLNDLINLKNNGQG